MNRKSESIERCIAKPRRVYLKSKNDPASLLLFLLAGAEKSQKSALYCREMQKKGLKAPF